MLNTNPCTHRVAAPQPPQKGPQASRGGSTHKRVRAASSRTSSSTSCLSLAFCRLLCRSFSLCVRLRVRGCKPLLWSRRAVPTAVECSEARGPQRSSDGLEIESITEYFPVFVRALCAQSFHCCQPDDLKHTTRVHGLYAVRGVHCSRPDLVAESSWPPACNANETSRNKPTLSCPEFQSASEILQTTNNRLGLRCQAL